MEGFWVGCVAVMMTILITSCNNAENVVIDCATKGKYQTPLSVVAVDCSVAKKEAK